MIKNIKGITLITLVITIVILIILAGIGIISLTSQNGLFTRAKESREKQIKAEMYETLVMGVNDMQIEKLGYLSLKEITEESLNKYLNEYTYSVEEDTEKNVKIITMERNGVVGVYEIDANLNIREIEIDKNAVTLKYEIPETATLIDNKTNINIKITAFQNIKQVEDIEGNIIFSGNSKVVEINDFAIEIGQKIEIFIVLENETKVRKEIEVKEFYFRVEHNLDSNIVIDNPSNKAEYNKPYNAKLILKEQNYIIDNLQVTMAGAEIPVDKKTGEINIEKVTGKIVITASSKEFAITTSNPFIGTNVLGSGSSVGDNTQKKGIDLYIVFNVTSSIKEASITINPSIPYKIVQNGKYKFSITAAYGESQITKDIEIIVKKYNEPTDLVKYDAGEWTKEEIEELDSNYLYYINQKFEVADEYNQLKHENISGFNLTFGGFTYKGSTYENTQRIITSRNESLYTVGTSGKKEKFGGWQILESREENGKTYVTKIIHAGYPENFVFTYKRRKSLGANAAYILSGGTRYSEYNSWNGIALNTRNWDMYKDKNQLDIIEDVHCITRNELEKNTDMTKMNLGEYYWIADSTYNVGYLDIANGYGGSTGNTRGNLGIRPVVNLKDGVYISEGDGTGANPYILSKE